LARFAWQHRRVPGAAPFSLAALLVAGWSLAAGAETAAADLPTKLFWDNLQYISRTLLPVLWFALAAEHTGTNSPRLRRALPWLLVLPAVTLALALTNNWHGLMATRVALDTSGPLALVTRTPGAWFWVHTAYANLLLALSLVLLARAVLRQRGIQPNVPTLYRGQRLALIAGMLLPLAWNVIHVPRLWPATQPDLGPVVSAIATLVLVWGLFSFRLFDAVPVARDMVLDSLRDGVVVLDSRGCVADLNPAAAEALGWTRQAALNQAAAEAFAAWPALAAACTGQAPPPAELVLAGPDGERCFELRLSVLADPYGRPVGQLVMLHDMTDRKRVEDELRQLAVTDALTGLPNRRRFFEALAEEVRRARRYQTPLALLLLDVDDFKLLNDTYGHQAGDAALAALAQVLRQSSRASDVPTRQGGDEFALLLPHTGRIGAEVAARRLLEAVRAVTDPGGRPLSLSIGGAELDLEAAVGAQGESQAEAMLARADRALYAAKQAGRGGVVVAETPEWRLEAGG
jgi:diguanylate cyclase (GGDEF)-like protein/PAS domain S-box-containing protein